MATVQVEPGSKTVTLQLTNQTLVTNGANTRRKWVANIVVKQGQSVRVSKPGYETTYTSSNGNRYIDAGTNTMTTLVYRIS